MVTTRAAPNDDYAKSSILHSNRTKQSVIASHVGNLLIATSCVGMRKLHWSLNDSGRQGTSETCW